jgi:hypothetical protein
MNTIFQFCEQKPAKDFVAVVKNRFGLAAYTYDDVKTHILGEVDDEIERQIEELGCWLGARIVISKVRVLPRDRRRHIRRVQSDV